MWKERYLENEIFTDKDSILEVKEAVSRRQLWGLRLHVTRRWWLG